MGGIWIARHIDGDSGERFAKKGENGKGLLQRKKLYTPSVLTRKEKKASRAEGIVGGRKGGSCYLEN